jgi:hypothetical protein
MFGLMDQLAEAVVESTGRIKTLEKNHNMARESSGRADKTSEQLAKMTVMMSKMMDRMEHLEDRKRSTQPVKTEPHLGIPNNIGTK